MVLSIGADHFFDYTQEDFAESGQHYDVIFDLVANHSFSEHARVLNPKGIYIGAGILGLEPSIIEMLASQISEFVSSRFVSQKFTSFMAKLNQEDLNRLGELMSAGTIRPVIDRSYSLSETAEAVRYLAGKHAQGKVIIDVSGA